MFENEPRKICLPIDGKRAKRQFFASDDKAENHINEGEGKKKQQERGKWKGGEKRKTSAQGPVSQKSRNQIFKSKYKE